MGKGKTGPQVIDVQENEASSTTLMSTEDQINTLKGIIEYNKGLKPARRAKDSLPEIICSGIATRDRITKDPKKGKIVVDRSYHQIGLMDGGIKTSENSDAFSLTARQKAI